MGADGDPPYAPVTGEVHGVEGLAGGQGATVPGDGYPGGPCSGDAFADEYRGAGADDLVRLGDVGAGDGHDGQDAALQQGVVPGLGRVGLDALAVHAGGGDAVEVRGTQRASEEVGHGGRRVGGQVVRHYLHHRHVLDGVDGRGGDEQRQIHHAASRGREGNGLVLDRRGPRPARRRQFRIVGRRNEDRAAIGMDQPAVSIHLALHAPHRHDDRRRTGHVEDQELLADGWRKRHPLPDGRTPVGVGAFVWSIGPNGGDARPNLTVRTGWERDDWGFCHVSLLLGVS